MRKCGRDVSKLEPKALEERSWGYTEGDYRYLECVPNTEKIVAV